MGQMCVMNAIKSKTPNSTSPETPINNSPHLLKFSQFDWTGIMAKIAEILLLVESFYKNLQISGIAPSTKPLNV
jgi:hypothetical protein